MKQKIPSSRRTKGKSEHLDWGSYEFETRKPKGQGAIMLIASTNFATIQKDNTIIEQN